MVNNNQTDIVIRSQEELLLVLGACLDYLDGMGAQMAAIRLSECLDQLALLDKEKPTSPKAD